MRELLEAGHRVTGLARSDASAEALRDAGAEALRGDLKDFDTLTSAARESDGVVHVGFVHDFSKYQEMCELDRQVISALGAGLEGSSKPLVATAGTATASGEPGKETDRHPPGASAHTPRAASEEAVDALVERGVRAGIVRPSPSVHGEGDHGFVPMLIDLAEKTGVSAYVADGANRWNAVHRLDAARVFALAVEGLEPGQRFHAVAEPEVPFRDIATAIGELLGLPTRSIPTADAEDHFGWLSWVVALDCPTSNDLTRARLDWSPTHPTLLDDLRNGAYSRNE
ncbi:NAD-dependent epimerase/dehydratase [Enhygromyxa salina]|uniref:NAD-dependent epimerase/dehydratase n=1 Tax=Enhygromyxa salina TaxID=215803 RepID=A0A0C1Z314_9BACT|nr:NAD-dependent epimerase/dehydratase [Enhygromyxa salina]